MKIKKFKKLREFYVTRRTTSQTNASQPDSQLNIHPNMPSTIQVISPHIKQSNSQCSDHNDQTNDQQKEPTVTQLNNNQSNKGLLNGQSNDKTGMLSMPRSRTIRQLSKPLIKAPGEVECGNPNCRAKYASAWRTNPGGGWLCNACGIL